MLNESQSQFPFFTARGTLYAHVEKEPTIKKLFYMFQITDHAFMYKDDFRSQRMRFHKKQTWHRFT
jgi:hypothetical protein